MKTLILEYPDSIDLDEQETRSLLASKLYESGKLSLSQGAEMAGYSKRDFMGILGNFNVSIFNYPASDIDQDVLNAKGYNL